ncbi:MAG: prepilin-type N-terminal cleavage/methylation domain-containing protein [Kiritimatiellae bacterium]|nr:prepilin-type N-terminal cleavage/methylation domain-containing protein [Kiritimatiellia bacterium]
MATPAPSAARAARGFTLLELLMVIAILAVLTAVIVPQFGAGMSGARLATAARTTIQAARYARTMALLHQAETVLSIGLDSGRLRVEAAPASGENAIVSSGDEVLDAPETATSAPTAAGNAGNGLDDVAASNRPAAAVTAKNFADELNAEFLCEEVRFRFLGYADEAGEVEQNAALPPKAAAGATAEKRIVFRSNGTCRPFRLRVMRDEEEWLDVDFDVTGAGKVRSEE